MVCATEKFVFGFHLSAGNRHDAPEGRKLFETLESKSGKYLLIDRVYEDDEIRALAVKRGLIPVVPPKKKIEKYLGNMMLNFTNVAMK